MCQTCVSHKLTGDLLSLNKDGTVSTSTENDEKRTVYKCMPKVTAVWDDDSSGGCICSAALGPSAPLPQKRGRMPARAESQIG